MEGNLNKGYLIFVSVSFIFFLFANLIVLTNYSFVTGYFSIEAINPVLGNSLFLYSVVILLVAVVVLIYVLVKE